MIESSEENNRLTRETVKVLDYPKCLVGKKVMIYDVLNS